MGRNIGHRIRYSSLILAVVALGLTLVVTWAGRTTGASSIALADNNNATAIYACVKANKFFHVSIGKPTTCPNGSAGVQWQGIVSPVAPSTAPATGSSSSASATSPAGASSSPASPPSSPAPATSSAAPSSTVTSTPSGAPCVTSELSGTCGPYDDVGISNASGYNTYVGNNMWACGSVQPGKPGADCGVQTVSAHDPGNWNVVSDQAAGNTGVLTYPDIQQVFTLTSDKDPAISSFSSITSTFAEDMHPASGTDAEAGYDLWLTNTSGPNEIMIWVDNVGRGSGGADKIGTATIGGQAFTVYQYGGGEIIFSLDQNEQSGTVDILGTFHWLQGKGLVSANASVSQVDFGWEICSTGGKPETFSVSNYTLKSSCASGAHCMD